MDIYKIQDIDHYYGDKQVISIDDLTVKPASIVGLIGPNGSGKSTLLKLLGFLEEPTYGSLLFKGKKVAPFSNDVRFKVTLLTQEPYLMQRDDPNSSCALRVASYGFKQIDFFLLKIEYFRKTYSSLKNLRALLYRAQWLKSD